MRNILRNIGNEMSLMLVALRGYYMAGNVFFCTVEFY